MIKQVLIFTFIFFISTQETKAFEPFSAGWFIYEIYDKGIGVWDEQQPDNKEIIRQIKIVETKLENILTHVSSVRKIVRQELNTNRQNEYRSKTVALWREFLDIDSICSGQEIAGGKCEILYKNLRKRVSNLAYELGTFTTSVSSIYLMALNQGLELSLISNKNITDLDKKLTIKKYNQFFQSVLFDTGSDSLHNKIVVTNNNRTNKINKSVFSIFKPSIFKPVKESLKKLNDKNIYTLKKCISFVKTPFCIACPTHISRKYGSPIRSDIFPANIIGDIYRKVVNMEFSIDRTNGYNLIKLKIYKKTYAGDRLIHVCDGYGGKIFLDTNTVNIQRLIGKYEKDLAKVVDEYNNIQRIKYELIHAKEIAKEAQKRLFEFSKKIKIRPEKHLQKKFEKGI